jgi:hypothetical protein
MERFTPDLLVKLVHLYGLGMMMEHVSASQRGISWRSVYSPFRERWAESPESILTLSKEIRDGGFVQCAQVLEDMAREYPDSDLDRRLPQLQDAIRYELRDVVLMRIPTDKAGYYLEPQAFGPLVAERFPSVSREVMEVGKCLAVGRGTACVFHLMRVLEAGLRELSKALKVKIKKERPSWNDYLTAIENKTKAVPGKKRHLSRSDEQFFSQAALHIRDISKAWRNPLVHEIADFYDDEEAMMIFVHVKNLMQHLAMHIRK